MSSHHPDGLLLCPPEHFIKVLKMCSCSCQDQFCVRLFFWGKGFSGFRITLPCHSVWSVHDPHLTPTGGPPTPQWGTHLTPTPLNPFPPAREREHACPPCGKLVPDSPPPGLASSYSATAAATQLIASVRCFKWWWSGTDTRRNRSRRESGT